MNHLFLQIFPTLTDLFGTQFTLNLAKSLQAFANRRQIRLPFAPARVRTRTSGNFRRM